MLRGEVLRLRPELVIVATPNDIVPNGMSAWVEYAPYADAPAKVCVGGRQRELREVGLVDLLAVVDEVGRSADELGGGC